MAPRQPDPAARADRRQRILDAAIPIFAANGFSQAGIAEIAEAAGVSFGSVHYYFGSKEALFEAAVLEPIAQLEAEMSIPEPETGDIPTALRRMARDHVTLVLRYSVIFQLVRYVLSQADRFPQLAEQVAFGPRFAQRLAPLLQESERRGELAPGSSLVTGTAYLAYLFGLSQAVVLDPDAPIWDEYADRALRILGVRE